MVCFDIWDKGLVVWWFYTIKCLYDGTVLKGSTLRDLDPNKAQRVSQ